MSAISLFVRPCAIRRSTVELASCEAIRRGQFDEGDWHEDGPRGLVVQPCSVVVSERTTCAADEHRTRAASYRAMRRSHNSNALRSGSSAACGLPSARPIAPFACATTARRTSVSKAGANARSSSRARRASSTSPIASMISTCAGKSRARLNRSLVALVSRLIAAHAASVRPCASRKARDQVAAHILTRLRGGTRRPPSRTRRTGDESPPVDRRRRPARHHPTRDVRSTHGHVQEH